MSTKDQTTETAEQNAAADVNHDLEELKAKVPTK